MIFGIEQNNTSLRWFDEAKPIEMSNGLEFPLGFSFSAFQLLELKVSGFQCQLRIRPGQGR